MSALSGLLLMAAFLYPAAAFADIVSFEGTPMEVQLWPGAEPGYTLFIVTAHIPETITLPATVRLPLPAAAEVLWAGEILGGPVSADPERASTVVDATGGRALEFTAEATRTVQYEGIGPPLSVVDGMTKSVFQWVQTVPAGEISFSVRVPPEADVVQLDPDAPGPPRLSAQGERLYTLRPVMLAEGQEFVVTAAYGRSGEGSQGAGERSQLLVTLFAALGIAALALVFAVVVQRRRAA